MPPPYNPKETPQEERLTFPPSQAALLAPYLPPPPAPPPASTSTSSTADPHPPRRRYPHVTLTYAHSLDASLAAAPGVRTVLSGAASKAMTHFLRTRHGAILVGAGTAVADDPGLNSRLAAGTDAGAGTGAGLLQSPSPSPSQPRPVVLDPRARWAFHEGSKMIRLARAGKGLGPFVLVARGGRDGGGAAAAAAAVDEGRRRLLEEVGGKYIAVEVRGDDGPGRERFEWADVLAALKAEGIESVMIEGGGEVINSLLVPPGSEFVDSVIVTIAPTWLGRGGVVVSPPKTVGEDGKPAAPVRLADVTWCPMGEDVVLCGRIQR